MCLAWYGQNFLIAWNLHVDVELQSVPYRQSSIELVPDAEYPHHDLRQKF